VDRDRQEEFLARIGARLVEGDLPERGSHGAAIHEAILKARGLSLGDEFGQVLDEEDATPGFFKVVGVLEGDARLGVIDLDYASLAASVLARRESFEVVYARPGGKEASDRHLRDARQADGAPAFRVIDEAFARRRVERSMENLPLLIGFLTGAVALIVALVTCLLNLISFQSRLDEFALYLALGHRRGRLARKLSVETGLTALLGWLVGLVVGFLALWIWRESVLVEKGILVSLLDMRPLAFSLAVPVLSFSVSALALARRLHRMDAVAVIQRRAA
jgi:ABC-type antimicrobial peptide transport system permease subunit